MLQLGLVSRDPLKMIGLTCEAYSQLRRSLPVSLNDHVIVGDIPLHHSALFRLEHGDLYFSNRLVEEGLVTVADLFRRPLKLGLFCPTFSAFFSL